MDPVRRPPYRPPLALVLGLFLGLGVFLGACDETSPSTAVPGPAAPGSSRAGSTAAEPATSGSRAGSPDAAAGPLGAGAGPAAEAGHGSAGGHGEAQGDTGLHNTGLDPRVVAGQNRFGLELHRWLAANGDGGNVFISPPSIALALAMAYNGAAGETQRAMAETIGFGGLPREAVNASHLALLEAWDTAGGGAAGVQLDIANSLWYREGFAVRPEFLGLNRRFYRAEVAALDFGGPGSVDTINAWVSGKTGGLIDNLVEQLDPDLVMLLVNAVYFKGAWTVPFDPASTQDAPFHLPPGGTRDVAMMYRDGVFDYYRGEGFQAVRLPYGEAGRLAMYVFLPSEPGGLADFHGLLSPESWEEWVAGFAPARGQVFLPRMEVAFKANLARGLQALGMGIAFDPQRADFSGMAAEGVRDRLSISDVVHQSVLDVNEEGTEAAAATSVGVRVTSMPVYDFQFRADRPFFIAIRDDTTGALLFTGSIVDPQGG